MLFGAPPGLDVVALGLDVGAEVVEATAGEYRVAAPPTPANVAAITAWLARHDLPLADLRAGRQRLDDVFRRLTDASTGAPGDDPLPAPDGGRGRATGPEAAVRAYRSQLRTELALSSRQGEQLLVSLGIPLLILVFFSTVDILPTGTTEPIEFLAPAVLALAVMSTSLVSLGIGTGFERTYGVLKRLGASPLGRGRWVAAKITTVLITEALQWTVLIAVALAAGVVTAAVGLGSWPWSGHCWAPPPSAAWAC